MSRGHCVALTAHRFDELAAIVSAGLKVLATTPEQPPALRAAARKVAIVVRETEDATSSEVDAGSIHLLWRISSGLVVVLRKLARAIAEKRPRLVDEADVRLRTVRDDARELEARWAVT